MYKSYKIFFSLLIYYLKIFNIYFKSILNFKGLNLLLTGKMGLKGNIKKKKHINKIAKTSLTTKKLNLIYNDFLFKTKIGVFNLFIYLFF